MTQRAHSSRIRALLTGMAAAVTIVAVPACSATEQVAEKVNNEAKQISVANRQVCATEYTTLATAAEAAMAMNGAYPATKADLVALGMMVEPPADLDYAATADGGYVITPAPGGSCGGLTP